MSPALARCLGGGGKQASDCVDLLSDICPGSLHRAPAFIVFLLQSPSHFQSAAVCPLSQPLRPRGLDLGLMGMGEQNTGSR